MVRAAVSLAALVWVAGCTPHARLQALHDERAALDETRRPAPPLPGWRDVAGVIHVHTELSHDSRGTMDEIVAAAQANHLGFVLLTDHHQPKVYDRGFDGSTGGVVFIHGSEVIKGCSGRNGASCNSLLLIGMPRFLDHKSRSMQQLVDDAKAAGALVFVAHAGGFADWSVEGYDGLEIFDLLDAAVRHPLRYPKYYFDLLHSFDRYPEELYLPLLEEPTEYLARWDALSAHRRVVAIAGNDAHQNVRVAGRQIDPYPLSFKVVRTHLLLPELNRDEVLRALAAGHAYVAFDLLADAHGFVAWAEAPATAGGGEVAGILGDEVGWQPGLRLQVRAPVVGQIRLIRDGRLTETAIAQNHSFALPAPGVYRVEVYIPLQGQYRPWIYANPIYARPPGVSSSAPTAPPPAAAVPSPTGRR